MVQSISQLLSYLVGEVTISAKHLAENSELEIIVEDTGPQPAPQGHAMVKPSPWFQIVNRRLKQLHSSLNYFEPQPLNHQGCGISESCLPRIFEPFWIDAARPKQAQTFQAGVTQTFLICVCETSEEM